MATCPECDAPVEIDEVDAGVGDEISCTECGQNLVVVGTDPLELDFATDEDDEDEDEDDDLDDEDDELDDDDADDDEDEAEDGDWDE
jgi:alpha-aminoadipate carrier protein LysW